MKILNEYFKRIIKYATIISVIIISIYFAICLIIGIYKDCAIKSEISKYDYEAKVYAYYYYGSDVLVENTFTDYNVRGFDIWGNYCEYTVYLENGNQIFLNIRYGNLYDKTAKRYLTKEEVNDLIY